MGSRSEHLSSIFSGSPLSGFRNKIINGGFDIWQRGVSQSAAGHGSADRWRFYFGTGAGTVSRQAFDLGQTDVPGNPRFFCRHDLSSLAGAGIGTAFGQRIEDVRTLAGRKATLSFYARAEYEQALGARAIQDFGTGGSPSAAVETLIDEFTVGQTWQKFTATVSLPSIAGKTLGSNDNSNVRIDISRNDAATIGGLCRCCARLFCRRRRNGGSRPVFAASCPAGNRAMSSLLREVHGTGRRRADFYGLRQYGNAGDLPTLRPRLSRDAGCGFQQFDRTARKRVGHRVGGNGNCSGE